MAQAASIVLNDGQATPVAHTFAPERVTPELSIFVDRSTGISARFARLVVRFLTGQKTNTGSIKISVPVYGTLPSGAEGVLRTNRLEIKTEMHVDSTDAERRDLFAFGQNSLSDTLLKGALRDLDPMY